MIIYKTKLPKTILLYTIFFLINVLITWLFIFYGHVLVFLWIFVLIVNLFIILAIYSGWKRSVLLLDEIKIVICRPSGWIKQVNLIYNLFEINHVEFDGNYILIGRHDSSVATKFGPLVKVNQLKNELKRLIPKVVL